MNMCIFCQIINKEIPTQFVFEDEKLVAFKDINPKAPVHLLIVPKKHIESVAKLAETDKILIGEMIWRAKILAEKEGIADKGYKLIFNCGEHGGQLVKHIHLHLLGGKKLE
ncbi:MAG: histidine triad nucleotide-binding protein [Patescibacteria group bacterium]